MTTVWIFATLSRSLAGYSDRFLVVASGKQSAKP
jgi:hypothetical protein